MLSLNVGFWMSSTRCEKTTNKTRCCKLKILEHMDSRPSSRFLRYFVGLATVCLSGWLAGQVAKTDAVGLALTVTQPASPPTGEVIGTPSPRNANYSIDVRLDPDRRTLTGRETVTWRNISNITTQELQFHLYYNAWKNTQSTCCLLYTSDAADE